MPETWLTNEQKIDALKFISQTQRGLHEQRQRHELKVFFTTATLFILLGAAPYTGQSVLPSPMPPGLVILSFAVPCLIAFMSHIYLRGIHKANVINMKFAQAAEDRVRELLEDNGLPVPTPLGADDPKFLSRLWQPIVLWILAIAAAFLLTLSSNSTESQQTESPAPAKAAPSASPTVR